MPEQRGAGGTPRGTVNAGALLRVNGLSVEAKTRRGPQPVLREVSFAISPGETLAMVGESGSGKTVTALAVMNLLPPGLRIAGGVAAICRTPIAAARSGGSPLAGVSLIFQNPHAALNPVFRIESQFLDVMRAVAPISRRRAHSRALELLGRTGLEQPGRVLRAYPHELSGGMAQRVFLAMALSRQPALLIADEPTTALDVIAESKILALLKRLQQEQGFALWLITHDIALAEDMADAVIVMKNGRIVEHGATAEVLHRPRRAYTRTLLAAAGASGVGLAAGSAPAARAVSSDAAPAATGEK